MQTQQLIRKDMDSMVVETVMITRFTPIHKTMKFIGQIFINSEKIEETEHLVADSLEDKNSFFISISNNLQERASEILREIYSRQ